MKKLWIAALIIVAVAALPFFTAPQAEKAYAAGILELNQYFKSIGIPLKIKQVSYEKGFLTSKAIDRIEFEKFNESATDPSHCAEITTEVAHGYLDLFSGQWGSSETALRHPSEQSDCVLGELYATKREFVDFYQQSFAANGPMVVSTGYKFNGSAVVQLTVNPFDFDHASDEEKMELSVSRLKGEMDINSTRDKFGFDLSWPGIAGTALIDGEVFQFKVGDYSASGDQHLAYPNLWIGSVVQTIRDIEMEGEGQSQRSFGLSSFTLNSDSSLKDDKLNSSTQMTFSGITSASQDLGELSIKLDFSEFDAPALDSVIGTINDSLVSMQAAAASASARPTNEKELYSNLKKIAETGRVELKALDYGIGGDNAHIDGTVNLVNLDAVPIDLLIANPFMLINHLKVNLNAELDEALVKTLVNLNTELSDDYAGLDAAAKTEVQEQLMMQFTQAAQNFTQTKYLNYDAENGRYKTDLFFEHGSALVNDQPFAIPGS